MIEEWKDIKGFEQRYFISNLGNVISNTKRPMILSPAIDKYGYLVVGLRPLNGKIKLCKVHRLVAIAFIENTENKKEVNHIDGNKSNNSVSNLEWNTTKENVHHAHKIGLRDYVNGKNPSAKKVINTVTGEIYNSVKECAEKEGQYYTTLVSRLTGKYKNNTNFKYA